MKCWRINLHRNFSRYLDGELDREQVKRLENHLLDCGWCRAQLTRLRDGQRLALRMPRPSLKNDQWGAIEKALDAKDAKAEDTATSVIAPSQDNWRTFVYRPGPAIVITALVFLAVLLLAVATRQSEAPFRYDVDLNTENFQAVAIADISNNTRPHVVTEGYVSEVRLDPNGGLKFRLVEDLRQPEPFIVCEIIWPIRIKPPDVGSRVRVYGVSRYDNQPGRQWHEVHPVLNIEVVK